jgi:hypothetical protein
MVPSPFDRGKDVQMTSLLTSIPSLRGERRHWVPGKED